jgi:DNA-binding XRE family transcriptional regulator
MKNTSRSQQNIAPNTPDVKRSIDKIDIFDISENPVLYFRKRLGLTQTKLALMTGITASRISMIENSEKYPSDWYYDALADIFDVDRNDLRKATIHHINRHRTELLANVGL